MHKYFTFTVSMSNMHVILAFIIFYGISILFHNLTIYLSKSKDKTRLRYIVLTLLFVQYNVAGLLFIDKNTFISAEILEIVRFVPGIIILAYIPYYIYKFLNLKKLHFYACYGPLYFLFIPLIVAFFVLYLISGYYTGVFRLLVIIPFIYSILFLFILTDIYYKQIKKRKILPGDMHKAIAMYLGSFLMVIMPIVYFFNLDQLIEYIATNSGFIIISVVFTRKNIIHSSKEYQQLQKVNHQVDQHTITKELEHTFEQHKTRFIKLVHLVKDPLTLAHNYLNDYIAVPEKNKIIGLVKKNVDIIKDIIVTYFNEEKFLKGIIPYNHNKIINITEVIDNSIELFSLEAEKKDIKIKKDLQDDKLYIKADPLSIYDIILNLLGNSVKYAPKGIITVKLAPEQDKLVLSIKDNGPGIPEEYKEKIFEPYFQVYNNESSTTGFGIGLSTVKTIVESLDGKISFKNLKPHGCEFKIILKKYQLKTITNNEIIELDENSQEIYNEIPDVVENENKHSVLIVEDYFDMLCYMHEKLSTTYNVYTAANGKKALEKLSSIPIPDVIISDIMMEEIGGFELYKKISEDPKLNSVPFIFLTAKDNTEDKLKGLNLGAVDYISKPFEIEEIMSKIKSVITNSQKQKDAVLYKLGEVIKNKSYKDEISRKNEKLENACYVYKLTEREKEIVKLIAQNLTYKEIGNGLNIAKATVNRHIMNIYNKTGVNNKLDLLNKLLE